MRLRYPGPEIDEDFGCRIGRAGIVGLGEEKSLRPGESRELYVRDFKFWVSSSSVMYSQENLS